MNPVEIIPAAGLGAVLTWLSQTASTYFKTRGDRANNKESIDATLEQHRDKLTFELLKAAREEVAAARVEASEIRTMQLRLVHFDEAIDHIEMLLAASNDAERADAARRATQFLTRMKRFGEAAGAIRNEAQIQQTRNEHTDDQQKINDLVRKIP